MPLMGYQGQLFYGTAGTTATNQVLQDLTDVNVEKEPSRGNTTHRGDGTTIPKGTSRVTSLTPKITFTMLNRPANAALIAFRAAANTGAAIAIRQLDVAGGSGIDADFTLSESNGQPLAGEQTIEFSAEATDEYRAPQLYV